MVGVIFIVKIIKDELFEGMIMVTTVWEWSLAIMINMPVR